MRTVSMIIGITFLFISAMPVMQAYADRGMRMENPCGKSMNPCEKRDYMEKHMQKKKMKMRIMKLMEEGMGMWVETVELIKESASDPAIKRKAAALEKRMRANVQEHKELHKKMHEMKSGHGDRHMGKGYDKHYEHGEGMHGGGSNPCDKMGM